MKRRGFLPGLFAAVAILAAIPAFAYEGAQEPVAAAQPITKLSSVMILVADQEAALQWYTTKLGFEKKVDEPYGEGQRWLTVVPKSGASPEIVLEKASGGMAAQVGKGTAWVFETDDCRKAYETLSGRGVEFVSKPQAMPWGVQAVFKDLYGNLFTLISAK